MDRQLDRDRETEEILMQIERDEEADIPTVKQTDRQRQTDGWMDKKTQKKTKQIKRKRGGERQTDTRWN